MQCRGRLCGSRYLSLTAVAELFASIDPVSESKNTYGQCWPGSCPLLGLVQQREDEQHGIWSAHCFPRRRTEPHHPGSREDISAHRDFSKAVLISKDRPKRNWGVSQPCAIVASVFCSVTKLPGTVASSYGPAAQEQQTYN